MWLRPDTGRRLPLVRRSQHVTFILESPMSYFVDIWDAAPTPRLASGPCSLGKGGLGEVFYITVQVGDPSDYPHMFIRQVEAVDGVWHSQCSCDFVYDRWMKTLNQYRYASQFTSVKQGEPLRCKVTNTDNILINTHLFYTQCQRKKFVIECTTYYY